MKLILRRVLIGLVCGTVSSPFLCSAVRDIGLGVFLGALLGIAQIFAFFDLRDGSAIDRAMTSGALGLPLWATRVVDARPGSITLNPSEEIATETFVWTAGATPNPILKELPVKHDSRGAVLVDRTLAVPGYGNVWALGDCAAVPDIKTGKTCPPTAQVATRAAVVLAHNIRACLIARSLKEFCFKSLGTLCIVGYHTACAEIRGRKFSGLFAWLLWRGIYLSKLPGLERKVRVLTDWTLELFFSRDIVQTIDFKDSGIRQKDQVAVT